MTRILGLDLGVASIGWAYIEQHESEPAKILGTGVRIIPLFDDERDEFSQGNAISKHQKRTLKRTLRKGYDRYQLRKYALRKALNTLGALPDASLFVLTAVELYALRDKALKEQLTLPELGRIWLHLNQKRGYKGSRADDAEDKKQTNYVAEVNERFRTIRDKEQTVGQHFYAQLKTDPNRPVKGEVFPREAYQEEFDAIWDKQATYYPARLTDELRSQIRDRIIYYQRPLKSKKGLVSICDFEGQWFDKGTKKVFAGPKVTPRSSPLFQVCKIWESINNITIKHKSGSEFTITHEHKQVLFEYLDTHANLSPTELFKLLKIGKNDGFTPNEQIKKKGIQGNVTKAELLKILDSNATADKLLRFSLVNETYTTDFVDLETGELQERERVTAAYEQEPLYGLWHLIYSTPEKDLPGLHIHLMQAFDVTDEEAEQLVKLDFTRGGFSNKSARAIRKILPYLQLGSMYSEACAFAGYNHSNSRTKEENLNRELADKLELLTKNSLRQPVVEKILNQMIHLVNAILEAPEFGKPDEIRVELARELKQSKEERNDAYAGINERERDNEKLRKELLQHDEFKKTYVSKRDLDKYRLWLEFDGVSPYEPNKQVSLSALFSNQYDIEHIIPRSRLFDDSFSNKTICRRELNSGENGKNQQTGYDFMLGRPDFEQYLEAIEAAFAKKTYKIGRAKRDKLLMTGDKIPAGFVDRQLRQTQYISRKAREILDAVCRDVHASSGGVTDYLRQQWGYNEVLENLQLERYRAAGQTEMRQQKDRQDNLIEVERIKDWSKRDDHRHHAIDALVVACTNPKIIKRLNDLNQTVVATTNESRQQALKNSDTSGLKNFIEQQRLFTPKTVADAVEGILISYKQGRKVTARAKRVVKRNGVNVVVQSGIPVPRGPLHEESVYGRIRIPARWKLDHRFELAHLIANTQQKKLVQDRLKAHNHSAALAFAEPIWLDKKQTKRLTHVEVNEWQYVISYALGQITKADDVRWIVDKAVRDVVRTHLQAHDNNVKKAFGDLVANPVWLNKEKGIAIKRVRMFTGLEAVEGIWKNEDGKPIGFVKPGSNHHIAIYSDENGNLEEYTVTFLHAVQRQLNNISPLIKTPKKIWIDIESNDTKYNNDFLSKLPKADLKYLFHMKINDLFIFDIERERLIDAINFNDNNLISKHLFRVRKLATGQYHFNHHYETKPLDSLNSKQAYRCIQTSMQAMINRHAIKVVIDRIGRIRLAND